jgi:hypothetical protein
MKLKLWLVLMLVISQPSFMPLRDPQGKQYPLLLVTRPMLLSLLMGLLGKSHHPLPLRLRAGGFRMGTGKANSYTG